jgi:hypothetical protein
MWPRAAAISFASEERMPVLVTVWAALLLLLSVSADVLMDELPSMAADGGNIRFEGLIVQSSLSNDPMKFVPSFSFCKFGLITHSDSTSLSFHDSRSRLSPYDVQCTKT